MSATNIPYLMTHKIFKLYFLSCLSILSLLCLVTVAEIRENNIALCPLRFMGADCKLKAPCLILQNTPLGAKISNPPQNLTEKLFIFLSCAPLTNLESFDQCVENLTARFLGNISITVAAAPLLEKLSPHWLIATNDARAAAVVDPGHTWTVLPGKPPKPQLV